MREHILRVTIKDCDVQTFRAGGKGGQNQNKRDTGVRVIHRPSGAVGESREERSQLTNKRRAFVRMAQSRPFTQWVQIQVGGISAMDDQMRPEDLKIEVLKNGHWTEIPSSG